MLNGTLTLHDIRDVEAFVASIVTQNKRDLSTHDCEDLNTYLIEEAWILSTRYQPGRIAFSTWAQTTLRLRIVDWQRSRYGRTTWTSPRSGSTGISYADTYERPRPQLTPLNDQLGDTHAQTHGDPPRDRNASDLVRLLRTRSSDEAWRNDRRRKTLPRRAA